jgi:hypothetical protein
VDQAQTEYARWDTDTKSYLPNRTNPALLTADEATHIYVQFRFLDPNDKLPMAERARYYQKYIPIPDGVKN